MSSWQRKYSSLKPLNKTKVSGMWQIPTWPTKKHVNQQKNCHFPEGNPSWGTGEHGSCQTEPEICKDFTCWSLGARVKEWDKVLRWSSVWSRSSLNVQTVRTIPNRFAFGTCHQLPLLAASFCSIHMKKWQPDAFSLKGIFAQDGNIICASSLLRSLIINFSCSAF